MRGLTAPALALVLVVLGAHRAAAAAEQTDDPRTEAAREVFHEAVEAARAGRWIEAENLYRRSYELRPAPATLYSLAVAQRETGELVASLQSFRHFLAMPATPELATYRTAARRTARLLSRTVARLSIAVRPTEGVELFVDGKRFSLNRHGMLDPGLHTVEARAPGHRTKVLPVRLEKSARERLVVELEPVRTEERPKDEWEPPMASIVAVGAGSALLSAGVTSGVVGLWTASEAEDESDAELARRLAIAADVMAVTGAVAAGLGVAFWFVDAGTEDERDRAAVVVTPSSAGLRVTW